MTNTYYNNKFVESIIYDAELEEKIKSGKICDELDLNFLINLNNYLNLNKRYHFIDDELKIKLLNLIQYIRFNLNHNNIPEYTKIINEIITKLNQIEQYNTIGFYYNEANARAQDSNQVSYNEKIEKLFYMKKEILHSISYDFRVLCDLTKSREEYNKIFSKYIGDGWFMCSIKGIYNENEQIFDNPLIRSNLECVINANEKILLKNKNLKNCNNEIKQKILKR